MAVLHLELDIDSDVHPELHAALAAIRRDGAREEKVRQLAATGLIWEVVRLHGPGFVDAAPERPGAPPPSVVTDLPGLEPAGAVVDAGTAADHPPVIPEDVPMLVDVVPEDFFEAIPTGAGGLALGERASSDASLADAGGGAATAEPVAPRRSARMRRMKESGLFQTG